MLSVHDGAMLGGAAAAWWLGLVDTEPRKHLVYTRTRGRARRSSATVVVRYRTVQEADAVIHQGLRSTGVALTTLDASVEVGIDVIDRALLTSRVGVDDLLAAHARYPRRHGAALVSGYLRLVADGARSEAERRTVALLRDAGIDGWLPNQAVGGYVIDFVFPAARVAVEIDGFAFHRDPATFQRDRAKRNLLVAQGWTVLNFTWADIVDRPGSVAAQIRGALADAA